MLHLATPRKSDHTIPDVPGSWTLRSAGGARPALVVWGAPPADPVLDRLARAGLAVLTAPAGARREDLVAAVGALTRGALGGVPFAPVGVASAEPADAELTQILTERQIPWCDARADWDQVPRWFAAGLK